jgi:hypothetical protein
VHEERQKFFAPNGERIIWLAPGNTVKNNELPNTLVSKWLDVLPGDIR